MLKQQELNCMLLSVNISKTETVQRTSYLVHCKQGPKSLFSLYLSFKICQ